MTRFLRGTLILGLLPSLVVIGLSQAPINLGTVGDVAGFAGGFTARDMAARSDERSQALWSAMNQKANRSQVQTPSGSVSMLDIKAPQKARREYHKGFQLLEKKNFSGAVEHLTKAISIYSKFVAAHNSLGSAYLDLGQISQARDEFAKAVSLDDHLPNSYLNLGCAELALHHYALAEQSIQKAATMAPLDLQLQTALAYAALMNRDYAAVVATARQVHARKHDEAAIIHYYAAAAWEGQQNRSQATAELQTLLSEDPKSPAGVEARAILTRFKSEQQQSSVTRQQTLTGFPASASGNTTVDPVIAARIERQQKQERLQDSKEQRQIEDAESDSKCDSCSLAQPLSVSGDVSASQTSPAQSIAHGPIGWTLHSTVDEVAVLFAATSHGKSVPDLSQQDISIRDDQKAPVTITGFRNESQLPLRLGIILDTSESVTGRFSFEQRAAVNFLHKILTDRDDLAFVVGVANSVLLVQDYTGDQSRLADAIGKLAPAGGTALWDAVAFSADKLAALSETLPVARMLVVISDGKDNSSHATLAQAIESAERGEVFVYTVSTREAMGSDDPENHAITGDHALRVLAERTGGAAFMPGSLASLNHGLEDLQEVIRGRYLISYKPALFKNDGQYRTIEITAQKSGHKLRMYARKGYYARAGSATQSY